MAGEVFRIVGTNTELEYASGCLPDASDTEMAYAIDGLFDLIKSGFGYIPEIDDLRVEVRIDIANSEKTVWLP